MYKWTVKYECATNFELNKRLTYLDKFTRCVHFLSQGCVCKLEVSSIENM